jgi:hypothetical protein
MQRERQIDVGQLVTDRFVESTDGRQDVSAVETRQPRRPADRFLVTGLIEWTAGPNIAAAAAQAPSHSQRDNPLGRSGIENPWRDGSDLGVLEASQRGVGPTFLDLDTAIQNVDDLALALRQRGIDHPHPGRRRRHGQ